MSLFVAIKTGSGPQNTKQLGRAEAAPGVQLRGWCVHAVGGDSGKTLTQARRDSIRKAHNKIAPDVGGRCSHHVTAWKSKLARKCGVVVVHRPAPARQVQVQQPQAQVVGQPVAQAAQPPVTARAHLRSFMDQLDGNRDNITDGTYLRVANALQSAFHQAGPN